MEALTTTMGPSCGTAISMDTSGRRGRPVVRRVVAGPTVALCAKLDGESMTSPATTIMVECLCRERVDALSLVADVSADSQTER